MEPYRRLYDDHDGTFQGEIVVMFSPDGDARLTVTDHRGAGVPMLRFRMPQGGGQSLRTRVALLILAEAIRLDDEEHPGQVIR